MDKIETSRERSGEPLSRERFLVAMGDTDAAQVIYFAAPLHWAERLANAWFVAAGVSTRQLLADGFGLPAVRTEANYESPLRLDDEVEATLWLHHRSRQTLTLRSEFVNLTEGCLAAVVVLTQVHAEVTDDGAIRPLPLPERLIEALGSPASGS